MGFVYFKFYRQAVRFAYDILLESCKSNHQQTLARVTLTEFKVN